MENSIHTAEQAKEQEHKAADKSRAQVNREVNFPIARDALLKAKKADRFQGLVPSEDAGARDTNGIRVLARFTNKQGTLYEVPLEVVSKLRLANPTNAQDESILDQF